LYLFNEMPKSAHFNVTIQITKKDTSKVISSQAQEYSIDQFAHKIERIKLTVPAESGEYYVRAILNNPPPQIKYPVISQWAFSVVIPKISPAIKQLTVGVPNDEIELRKMLASQKIKVTDFTDNQADILLCSRLSWEKLKTGDSIKLIIEKAIDNNKRVVLLDVGPALLGAGYSKEKLIGDLQGAPRLKQIVQEEVELFKGLKINFMEVPEPESHIHCTDADSSLWFNLQKWNTWLWNGYKGGIIVPAVEMKLTGLASDAFISVWQSRGANAQAIKKGNYFAYELQGYYQFSTEVDDKNVIAELKFKVLQQYNDAPALHSSLNPNAEVQVYDLSSEYAQGKTAKAQSFIPLVCAGKNLVKTPVILIDFGKGKGKLILSQLLTNQRLIQGKVTNGLYDVRYDPAAMQVVLNMLSD